MVDLRARMVSDDKKIHNGTLGTGSFAVDLKFTDPDDSGNPLTIKGMYEDTALLGINPENGLPVRGAKIPISFHQEDLTIWDGLADLQRWKVEFTNGAGQSIAVEINDVIPDRSFGNVLCMTTIISGHR